VSLITQTIQRLHNRAHHRGPLSHQHVSHQRRTALILIITALIRVAAWMLLTILYVIGVAFAVKLFKSVAFVALISMFALILTDWGQFAASMAQLTAGDVHASVRDMHAAQDVNFDQIEADLVKLAELAPGPEAHALAQAIREQIENRTIEPA
jgi:hypothetical protein